MERIVFILALLAQFSAECQNRFDVVIDEIMADPSPAVGLPGSEWIELKNTSAAAISLVNWHVGDASGESGAFPDYTLEPGSFVIVCSANAAAALSAFGSTISVTSFPSLNNQGDEIFLRSAAGTIIHEVNYSIKWYRNELKKNGGWALEMIDTKNPCAGSMNWSASIDPRGGTPGQKNSIDGINPDQTPPRLQRAFAVDTATIEAVFDESLDSAKAASVSDYLIDGGLSVIEASPIPPVFSSVMIHLNRSMSRGQVYDLTVNSITDCSGNQVGSRNSVRVGMPSQALPSDIVINEILFNPRPNGFDYVELYNKGTGIVDASRLFVANRDGSGTISSIHQIFASPYYLFPGDYLVITEDAASLATNYFVKDPDAVIEIASMPSYPDDKGDVVLLNEQGEVVDEVKYSADWQFKLIENPDGVALERIDPAGVSQSAANWHSAASTAGYGTPGYKNSQYKQIGVVDATIEVEPRVFSPDDDGHDDIAIIHYRMSEPGWVANINIFNSQGISVRYLVKNATLGINGSWSWDGLNEKGDRLPIGTYIIYAELFNLRGSRQTLKKVIVLARKLN